MTPRVSVVMPTYQAGSYIGAAISSVLWQTFTDIELVVVDDGSTDGTVSVARGFRDRVRLVRHETNLGVAAARARGIAEACGELITFCDADDILFARHLEALVTTWDGDDGKRIVTGNAWYFFPSGIERSRVRYKGRFPPVERQRQAILEENFVSIMTLFPRSLVDEIGSFKPELRWAEDWEFWARAIFAGYHVLRQPQPLALIRWSSSGLSSAVDRMEASVLEVLRQIGRRDDLTDDERSYVVRRLSGPSPLQLSCQADDALRNRRYADAARLANEAADLQPNNQRLVWKARVLSTAPALTGPLVRARQSRIDGRLGL
ncbi:MAG: glycosyltransferase [Actinomycetota bacterium]|nr:glycosyltransferase [Actinomycetota bacterium]